MSRNIIFKCPVTGMNVQHSLASEAVPDTYRFEFEAVPCQACTRLHFINRLSGELLGEPKK
jgi:hypothetical protein